MSLQLQLHLRLIVLPISSSAAFLGQVLSLVKSLCHLRMGLWRSLHFGDTSGLRDKPQDFRGGG